MVWEGWLIMEPQNDDSQSRNLLFQKSPIFRWTIHVSVLGVYLFMILWSFNEPGRQRKMTIHHGSNDQKQTRRPNFCHFFQDRIVLISNWTQTLDLIERLWSSSLKIRGSKDPLGFVRNGGWWDGRAKGPGEKIWKEHEETGKNA